MNRMLKCLGLLLLISLVSACATLSQNEKAVPEVITIPLNYALFNVETNKKDNEHDIFYLTPEQEAQVLSLVNTKVALGTAKHVALSEVISSKLGGFTYYGETYPAEKVMRLNKGNCMSLAVLTSAFAQSLGLKNSFREVTTLPIFDKQNNLLLSSTHVQSVIYDDSFTGQKSFSYNTTPGIVIDYFPDAGNRRGKRVSKSAFIAMYYKNIASDALIEDDFDKAFYLAEKAYQADRTNISVINLLAVIHRRAGDVASAENIYKLGLQVDPSSLALMSNYVVLLKNAHRLNEADELERKLEQLDDPNPYLWLEQAYIAQMNGNTQQATRYYQKVITKAPYLNEPYVELAKIYATNGQKTLAKKMLVSALEWTYEAEERKQYKYKLYSLNANQQKR